MGAAFSYSVAVSIRRGRLQVDREALLKEIAFWPDCEATLTLSEEEPKRSNQANRYLFGVIYRDIRAYTGQTKDDIHDEMCARFTTRTINYTNPASGLIVELEVVKRTSGMTVKEFHEFVQHVKLFAAEFFGLTFEEPPAEFHAERAEADARAAAKQSKGAA